ncbi:Autophagy-related protein 13 homolog [Geodia barretti]|nr:Autophagy-related protein 13 homolog [Geodia barretti]
METSEGDSIVLEVWSIELDPSRRDVSVSVAHVLYPRLSLMLRSLVVLSRTTPAYKLSRSHEDTLKFTFRLYASSPDINTEGFRNVVCAKTSCSFGTISLSLLYLHTITLPDRPLPEPSSIHEVLSPRSISIDNHCDKPSLPLFPFTSHPTSGCGTNTTDHTPFFSTILPRNEEDFEREESHDTLTSSDGGGTEGDVDPSSLPTAEQEQDGYILVDLKHIKPTFAPETHIDELGQFLQNCRDVPHLDLFSGDNTMNLHAAMRLIDERTLNIDGHAKSVDLS